MQIDENYRITLPKGAFNGYFADEFVSVTIKKNGICHSFSLRIPTKSPSRKYLQVRRKVPKEAIIALDLHPHDNVEFSGIEKIKKEYAEPFKGNFFDLLSLKFDNVIIKPFAREGEEWVCYWKSSKSGGMTHPIELKRYIPINKKTGEFFGLMQAESRKIGYKFDFTNKLISEHKLFIEVAEQLGIYRSQWSFGVIYNPKLKEEDVSNVKELFAQRLGLNEQNGYITKSITVKNVAYMISISSTILNLIMNTVLKTLMEKMHIFADKNENFKDFCKGFVLKDLLGDGTIVFPSIYGMQIVISEQDKESQKYIMKMFEIFNISTNSISNRIYVSTNFESTLWFLQNNAFLGHEENRMKLQSYIKRNFYFTNLESRLKLINGKSTSRTFANASGLKLQTAKRFLERTYRRDFIKKEKYTNKNFYYLSEKGEEFLKVMTSL